MAVEMRAVYVASDGTPFFSKEECDRHEKQAPYHVLANRTVEELLAARAGKNAALEKAIERLAYDIRKTRYAEGRLRRRREKNGTAKPGGAKSDSVKSSRRAAAPDPVADGD